MKNLKNKLFLATAIIALASCSENTYLGDQEGEATGSGAISFNMSTPTLTRANGADAAKALGYQFKVYGVKYDGTNYSNVFATTTYSATDNTPYSVWYTSSTAGTTTSNTANWDYVGIKATGSPLSPKYGTTGHEVTLNTDQTIKYWDYSADKYEFVAYSATVGSPTFSNYQKDGFTVAGTAAELAGLYVADKLTITERNNTPTKPSSGYNQIGNIVQLTFRSAGTKVRLGIYETIPGYAVKNVKFRPNGTVTGFTDPTTTNAKLSGSFNGSSPSSSATFKVTYGPQAIFTQDGTTARSAFFDFGTFASTSTALGENSTNPMWASGSAEYQGVLPNTDNVGDMILYVDYDLYNSTSGETIHVKGAKAVVPSIYMRWNPNYAYTYLFKISDNTNGTTGTENTSPEGLFPITFDAVTIATTDGAEVGIITTVSTPAITTYQQGSVVDKEESSPAISEHGITYAASGKPIYITVNENGTLANLTGIIKLYKLGSADADASEADLILVPSKLDGKEVTGEQTDILTILSGEGETVQGIKFAATTSAKFTPSAGQTYAVEYTKTTYVKATGTFVSGTTYYTDATGDTTVDATSFTPGTTDVSSYYVANITKHYKVIKVAAS